MAHSHEKSPSNDTPSDVDLRTCRTVADTLPRTAWLMSAVAMCEKFAYYGFVIVLQDYIQYRSDGLLHPGALGLGQSIASLAVNCVVLLSYVTPLPAAVIADQYLGRYKTLLLAFGLYALALLILTITSIPTLLYKGAGLPGVIVCMVIVGLALGGVRSALPPFLAEQCKKSKPRIRLLKTGERVIVTHEETLEYSFNVYYWACNLGSQSMVVSTLVAKYVGYWLSFLIALMAVSLALILLAIGRDSFVRKESSPSVTWACRISYVAARSRFRLDAAKPESLLKAGEDEVPWDASFVDEMKKALRASRVGIPFIFYWLSQNQLISNTISQAGMMQTYGIPNDLLPDANALAVVMLLPVVTHVLNPALRRWRRPFPPVARIAVGFMFEALAMGYAAGVQGLIYASPPCFSRPLECAASDGGRLPNRVNFAIQLPVYIFEGLGEVFSNPAISEYTYTIAPASMKSVLQAILSLTAAAGSGLGMALAPMYHNPTLLVLYACLGGVMTLCAVGVLFLLRSDSAATVDCRAQSSSEDL